MRRYKCVGRNRLSVPKLQTEDLHTQFLLFGRLLAIVQLLMQNQDHCFDNLDS